MLSVRILNIAETFESIVGRSQYSKPNIRTVSNISLTNNSDSS